jgi:hypothetical protein
MPARINQALISCACVIVRAMFQKVLMNLTDSKINKDKIDDDIEKAKYITGHFT